MSATTVEARRQRRATYPRGSFPARWARLFRFLHARYGEPEGYGISIEWDGAEIHGATYRCRDRGRLVSIDIRDKGDRSEALLTIERSAIAAGSEGRA